MTERMTFAETAKHNLNYLFINLAFPLHVGIARVIDSRMGEGLTPQGRTYLRKVVVRILRGNRVSAVFDGPLVYDGADRHIYIRGEQNISESGSTLFIGNHTPGGPFASMAQFFEVARVGYEQRKKVPDELLREPFVLMQRGLTDKGKIVRMLSGKVYQLAGDSLHWEVIEPPRFTDGGDIARSQGLPPSVIERIREGGAMIWYPQGTHRSSDDFNFPRRTGLFLNKLQHEEIDVQLVPVRARPLEGGHIELAFGKAVRMEELPKERGRFDINYFAKHYIAVL